MDSELEAWSRGWKDVDQPGPNMTTLLRRARREATLMLVCGWGVTATLGFVALRAALDAKHPVVWVGLAVFTVALVVVMTGFMRRESRASRADERDVESALVELRQRLERELGAKWRFWTFQLLLLAGLLGLPWELWREGRIFPDAPLEAAATVVALNVMALGVLATQVWERRKQQKLADGLRVLATQARDHGSDVS